jgi:hypothetical protein
MVKTNYKARAKKAWETRRANASKRGVKPGTKRGPYKKARAKRAKVITLEDFSKEILAPMAAKFKDQWKVSDFEAPAVVGNLPSLISELQSSISQLEGQLTAQIDRIKSILG